MTPLLALACSLLVFAGTHVAESIEFDGKTYARQFVAQSSTIDLAEYVQPDETVDNWTTLVAVRRFAELDNPGRAAAQMSKTLKDSNPDARFRLLVKEDESEAMIDFLTWPKDGSFCEFNVFRYLKLPGQQGLIAYQFAYRFREVTPESTKKFEADRDRWIDEMTRVDWPIDFKK